MKNRTNIYCANILSTLIMCALTATTLAQGFKTEQCPGNQAGNNQYQKSEKVKAVIDEIVRSGVPGMVAAIEDNGVFWTYASGLAKIEDQTPMQTCHLHYLGSIPKIYMATLIMKLKEEGKIDLDKSITSYLSENLSGKITNAHRITVRMLLNHTSGIAEYNSKPLYISRLLQNPTRMFEPAEYLDYIKGKKAVFEAGSRYMYTNTNYEILSLIADQITGDHQAYMREKVFEPLNLHDSYYRIEPGNTYGNRVVNSYWDRYSDGVLENSSVLLNTNTASMAGDDGMLCSAKDAVNFLKGLMEEKIVSKESLNEMQQWVNATNGKPEYGLGIDRTEFNGYMAMGHSGGGLGTGCQLYYIPEKNVYFFVAINLATVTSSPIHEDVMPLLGKLQAEILK